MVVDEELVAAVLALTRSFWLPLYLPVASRSVDTPRYMVLLSSSYLRYMVLLQCYYSTISCGTSVLYFASSLLWDKW